MKNTKKLIALIMCVTMLLALTACKQKTQIEDKNNTSNNVAETTGNSEDVSDNTSNTEAADNTENSDAEILDDSHANDIVYPITVTDMIGREVVIESEPQKIVSGYYISSSACIALGLTDKIVAIEQGAAKRPIYGLAAASLIDIPNVGSAKAFDLETCLAVEPDLVILPMKQKDTAETLVGMGIPAIVVVPETQDQLIQMIELIAMVTNKVDRANEIVDYINDKLDMVAELTAGLNDADKPVVYMGGTGSYLTTAPAGMYQSALITAGGAKAAGAEIEGANWTEISYEQMLAMNPDIIVVPTNSQANGAPDYTIDDIKSDAQISDIEAIKNGRVYQMTYGFESWDSPVPSGVLGTLWMLKTVHPELMSEEEFVSEVQSFYTTFYGFTPAADSIN